MPNSFWRDELHDLKSKVRILFISLVVIGVPAATLLALGLPERVVYVGVGLCTAGLGLVWLTVRLWDDLHWGPLLDLSPWSKDPEPPITTVEQSVPPVVVHENFVNHDLDWVAERAASIERVATFVRGHGPSDEPRAAAGGSAHPRVRV